MSDILSVRQLEVLRLAATGKTGDEIAEILGISASTVKVHREAATRSLDACNVTHAVAKALSVGLLVRQEIIP